MDHIRTDLAEELRTKAMAENAESRKGELDGIFFEEHKRGDIRISTLAIKSKEGENLLGKPLGNYITISFPSASDLGYEAFLALCDTVAEELSSLCKGKQKALICGIGNGDFAADALGVIAASHVLVTHHLKEEKLAFAEDFADLAAMTPGITAKTGMESGELIRHAVETIRPEVVIAVDALAAREADRLARTIQLSDTGLSPGAGIGNRRLSLNAETLGVPVIAVGVPTMVDTATLVYDALEGKDLREDTMKTLSGLFVSPKEIDLIVKNLGKIIGYAINRAFHGNFSYEEMAMLA